MHQTSFGRAAGPAKTGRQAMTDTPMGDHEKMVDRVAKLLRQAEDAELAGRDAEMIAFQEKAFDIMATYGISEALARARQNGLDIKVDAQAASAYVHFEGAYQRMQAELFWEMSGAMQCQALRFNSRGKVSMRVYGMPDHLQRLQDIWVLLAPQAQRGMEKAHPGAWSSSSEVVMYRRSWLAGFGDTIGRRIRKAENKAAADAGALELYKSDKERAELALRTDYPHTSEVTSNVDYDSFGYDQGCQAGEAAQLHRSVT
jgi:hypothetical protein